MKRRLFVTLGILALLFALPGLPPVRNALLHWGASFAARAGYTVSYESSSGNLFYGVGLEHLEVTGPGVEVTAETAKLGYTLPALLTGKLPLRTSVTGVRGAVEVDKLTPTTPATSANGPNPTTQGGAWLRPVLEHATVSDVALNVSGVPFNVPDAKLTKLELSQNGDAFAFRTALAVKKAVLKADGTVQLEPFKLDATVGRADVALARSYFDGLQGGTVTGNVQADAQGVTGDLKLQGGQVALVGLELTQVSGPLTVKNQKITAELSGRALGGPLKGTGTVNLNTQHWQADVTGNAKLADALAWLGRGQLPQSVVSVLGPSGSAAVKLSVGGWQTFALSGQAGGQGRVLGEPLRNLNVDFGFRSALGTDVTATGALGGEPFRFALTPQGQGFTLTADGKNLPLQLGQLGQATTADVNVALTSQQGSLTGTTDLTLDTRVLGRSATLTAAAKTDGQGWQADLSGRDALGAKLTGGLELQGNVLDGTVKATRLTLPGLADPVTVTAKTDGPLSNLPLTLRVTAPGGVHPTGGGVRADADFSGQAKATLKSGALTGIKGDFGPLNLSGALDDLRYTLAPTALSGRAQGTVAVKNGQLTRPQGRFTATAQLETNNLRGAGVKLPDLDANVKLTQGNELQASVKDQKAGVNLSLQHGELTGILSGTRIGALGETFATNGTVKARAAQLGNTLNLNLQAKTTGDGPATTLNVSGNAQKTKLTVKSETGATLAGRTLGKPLTLSGNASLTKRQAELAGKLGGVDVAVAAKPDASGKVRTQAKLTGGGQDFTARFDSLASWSTDGTLPLSELGQALGLPLRGTVQTTLARQGETFSGQATVQGTAFGLPLEARAQGTDGKLTLNASSRLLGQPLTLSGVALPETDATLQLGDYGAVRVRGRYPALSFQGSGRVPKVTRAGLTLPAQPWELRGNLAQGRVNLDVGASRVTAARGPGGWALSAKLEQTATLRGKPLTLSANLTRTPQHPAGRVRGSLSVGDAPVKLAGTLENLTVTGNVPAGTLQSGLLGTLNVQAQVNALTQGYEVRSSWRYGDRTLQLRANGQRADVTASVQGNGLDAQFTAQSGHPSWTVQAADVALETLPVAALQKAAQNLGARLNGTLGSSPKGYRGDLRLAAKGAAVNLRGQRERLGLTATFKRGALGADATGTLLPGLNVTLGVKAGDAATFQGALQGSLAQPRLSGRITTAAQSLGGLVALPARRFEVGASLQNGLSASLRGDDVDVQLRDGRWRGTLALPFTLRGEPHRLSGTVQGALAEPVLDAAVQGRTVQGPLTLNRDGLTGELNVTPGFSALPNARVQADISASPDLSWQVALEGNATLPYRALPLALTGQVSGHAAQYSGAATVNVAGQEVPLTVSGKAGRTQAKAEFDEVDLSALAPVQGTLSGEARATATSTGLRYFADLSAQGSAAGRPFELTFNADHSTSRSTLELGGTVAGASISAQGDLPPSTLTVRVADSERPLELTAQLEFAKTLTLRGDGGWQGETLALNGAYTPSGDGSLRVSLGDATLTGHVSRTDTGRTLDASLDAPTGVLGLETPLKASLQAEQTGQTLGLSARGRLGENTLALSGTVPGQNNPQAALTGTLFVPAAGEPVALHLSALETGYLASLTQGDLILRGVLSPGFRPQRVRLIGALERPALTLQSDLVWQEGAGFSGRADATLSRRGAAATLTLLGQPSQQGQLQLLSPARYRKVEVATLTATLSAEPWRDRDVSGTLKVAAPAAQLSPVWPGDPLTLAGTLALSGTLTEPQLAGPLELRGALNATGNVRATRQGANLSLAGDGLRGVASLDTEGYRTTLTLTQLNLSHLGLPTTPATQPPTLSGALRAAGRWGGAPSAQSDLRLVSGQSRVESRLRYRGGTQLSGAVTLEARLQDFVPGWQGRVEGPIYLAGADTGSPLSSTLTLQGLGPKSADWQLGGRLGLSGSLMNPTLALALRGAGSAAGTLQATVTPRSGELELTTTLALLGAQTDLTLTRTRQRVSAAGTLAYGNFRAVLKAQNGGVQLRGEGKLAGWQGVYGPAQLSLSGPLKSLNPQLRGTLALTGAADLATLRGTLTGAAFGPVGLGNVAFSRGENGLEFRGDALQARLGVSGALPWMLTELNLTGPGRSALTLSGQGTRTQGRVSGTVATSALSLPLSAHYGPDGLALSAQGALPVGVLDLRARYRQRWRGQLSVTRKTPEGQLRVLSGNLTGTLTAPTLTGKLELTQGSSAIKGTFAASRETLALDAQATSPQLSAPVTLSGRGWPLTLTLSAPQPNRAAAQNILKLALQGGQLEPSGVLTLGVGPAELALRADSDPKPEGRSLVLTVGAPAAPGLVLRTTLPAALGDYAALTEDITFQGTEQLSGTLALKTQPTLQLTAKALRWRTPAGTLTLAGTSSLAGGLDGLEADLTGRWAGTAAPVPWLSAAVPFRVKASSGRITLSSAKLGRLSARYDPNAGRLTLQSDLTLGRGKLQTEASYTRADGPTGTLAARSVPIFSVGREVGTLSTQLTLGRAEVSGDGTLALAGGQLSISGAAGWARLLPDALKRFAPAGTETLSAQLRLNRFNVGGVPQVAARLPYLSAPVSGVATLSGTQIVGQLIAPELKVLANKLPTQVDFNGTLTSLEARATVADSRVSVRYSRAQDQGPSVSGLVTLESFPLQALPEAFVGASGVEAAVTGAARFDLPLRRPATGYVRLATERLTLQSTGPDSSGKATQGDVALRFENGRLYVERAEFRGDGFWQAQGVLTPENLDFTLEAQNADFTPLLRLAPPLAALGVGAQGSLDLQASGSASAPDITLTSPRLALQVAGSRYRAVDTTASLSGGAFGLKGALLGVAPITGRLELSGSGQLNLAPFATSGLALRFSGDATLPTLGRVSQIRGRIYPTSIGNSTGLQLSSSGVLGRPLRVSGSLTPLDLELSGQNLDVQARRLFVASSSTDVDLSLKSGGGALTLSGSALVNRAQLSLNRSGGTPASGAPASDPSTDSAKSPESSSTAAQTSAPPTAGTADVNIADTNATAALDPLASTASATAVTDPVTASSTSSNGTDPLVTNPAAVPLGKAADRAANPVLARIHFDNVTLKAPRKVLFNEAFGSAELGLDLTLSGTAAQPLLDGQAQTLDGSIRFSGQDFSLTRAVATFDPARGIYPALTLGATASFDKSRALGDLQRTTTFVEPPPTEPSFEVNLQITGGFEESAGGRRVLDLSPTLSSNAELQEGSGSPQPLTEPELVALLTLGRLQLDTAVGGANSLAGTVAESALDTAVDLLVVSELQDALNEALGTDILEIRTSAFSSILGADGGQKNFGVSVKLGGYLSDNLFASVQVGRFDDPEQAYALSNEFLLRYTAAPLELSLSGGVNFSDRLGSLSAATDFSLGLSYAITPLISLDASLDTTALNTSLDPAARGRNTSVGFGVSFVW